MMLLQSVMLTGAVVPRRLVAAIVGDAVVVG